MNNHPYHRQRMKAWLRRNKVRQRGLCLYCGYPFENGEPGRNATLDHYIPLSQGGADKERNTVAACRKCNQEKGSVMPKAGNKWWRDIDALHALPANKEGR